MSADTAEPPEDSAEELYEHAPCGYLSTRPDGTIVRINRTLLDWLGYERADLLGRRSFQSLLSVGGRVYYETHYGPLLAMQGTVREIAVELVRRDGSRLPALVNSAVQSTASGVPSGIRTTVFDATSRRRYERELLAARRAAELSEQRLAVLQEVVSDLAAALRHTDVVSVLVDKGRRAARATYCAVWLLTDDATTLEWVGGDRPPADPRLRRTPIGASMPHARSARSADSVVVASLADARAESAAAADDLAAAAIGAALFVPLVAADQVLGVAQFGYAEADAFDTDIHDLLRTVGRQAGQTLQRTGLFEVEKRLRRRAETLQRITAALAVPLEAQQIADAAAEQIAAALDFDHVLFVLGGPEPVPAVATGFAPATVARWRRDPAVLASLLEWPDTFFDAAAEHTGLLPGLVDGPPVSGVLAVLPLRVGPVVLGTLLLGRGEGRAFAPGERGFLQTFAAQCAQAFERARLHGEAVRRQREATFLIALSRRLDETNGLRQRAVELVAGLVPAVAARARVELVTDGQLERLAAAPEPVAVPDDAEEFVTAALNLGTATMSTHPVTGVHDVALPLRARGRVIGVLVIGVTEPQSVRDRSRFLAELAESAGLALENGRLYDQEHQNAHILQRGLLAGEPPRDPRAVITTWYRPAGDLEVGGDWHDAFLVGPDRLAIVVGDVVGRGIRAAATMGHLRSAVRALAATDPGPAGLLERLDRFVDRFEDGRMSTVAYGVLDLSTGRLRYACAGHVPPLLVDPDGRAEFLWHGRSTPIAAYLGMKERREAQVDLRPGSRLLLYTDGLVERRSGNLDADLDRLAAEAGSRARGPLGWLLPDLAAELADPQHRTDDVCMLCVAFGDGPEFQRTVIADVSRLKSVRDDLRAWLTTAGLPAPEREATLLACSEAVANAMEHGYGNDGRGLVEVRAVLYDDAVELTVLDRGTWREPDPRSDRGRGITLIGSLMEQVSVEHDGGTVVTMRRKRQPGGAP